jgi:hypothetical protein
MFQRGSHSLAKEGQRIGAGARQAVAVAAGYCQQGRTSAQGNADKRFFGGQRHGFAMQ